MATNKDNNGAIIGTVIGGLLLGATAAFIASRYAGKQFKYNKIKSRVEDFIEDLGDNTHSVAKGIGKKAFNKANDVLEFVKDEIDALSDPRRKDLRIALVAGGIIGGLLVAGSSFLLSGERPGAKYGFINNLGEKASNLKKIIHNVHEIIEGRIEEHPEVSRLKSNSSKAVNNVLDFALAGMEILESFKKK